MIHESQEYRLQAEAEAKEAFEDAITERVDDEWQDHLADALTEGDAQTLYDRWLPLIQCIKDAELYGEGVTTESRFIAKAEAWDKIEEAVKAFCRPLVEVNMAKEAKDDELGD